MVVMPVGAMVMLAVGAVVAVEVVAVFRERMLYARQTCPYPLSNTALRAIYRDRREQRHSD